MASAPTEITMKVKIDTEGMDVRVAWEFLNADGQWIECVGGESHAMAQAGAFGDYRYRKVTTIVQVDERTALTSSVPATPWKTVKRPAETASDLLGLDDTGGH